MVTLIIFGQFILVVCVFLYAVSKVNKFKKDFNERLKVSTVESDRQIYIQFIKKYKTVNIVLYCCIIAVFIVSIILFKIFVF